MTDALFPLDPAQVRMDELAEQSTEQKRTARQMFAMTRGQHPLSVTFGHMPLHPDAAPADDRKAAGLRCGTCAWRRLLDHHTRTYSKCGFGEPARLSHGSATDLRSWWPACHDYEEETAEDA